MRPAYLCNQRHVPTRNASRAVARTSSFRSPTSITCSSNTRRSRPVRWSVCCERELGFYALEAASRGEADRREGILRRIWAHNENLGIARVHRGGLVLLVVWNDGVSPACWQAVNDGLVELLPAR
jgi:hypothetical protein